MDISPSKNDKPWNGVERRRNGTSPERVAIMCGVIRLPPGRSPVLRPMPDFRSEPAPQPRPPGA